MAQDLGQPAPSFAYARATPRAGIAVRLLSLVVLVVIIVVTCIVVLPVAVVLLTLVALWLLYRIIAHRLARAFSRATGPNGTFDSRRNVRVKMPDGPPQDAA